MPRGCTRGIGHSPVLHTLILRSMAERLGLLKRIKSSGFLFILLFSLERKIDERPGKKRNERKRKRVKEKRREKGRERKRKEERERERERVKEKRLREKEESERERKRVKEKGRE